MIQTKSFKNLNIRTRILISFTSMLILLIIVAYIGSRGISQVRKRVDRTIETNLIVQSIKETRQQEKNFVIYGDESYISLVDKEIQQILDQAASTREAFSKTENKALMDTVMEATLRYRKAFRSYVELEQNKNMIIGNMRAKANNVLSTIRELDSQLTNQIIQDMRSGRNPARVQEDVGLENDANQIIIWFLEARKNEKEYNISGERNWYDTHEDLIHKTLDLAAEVKSRVRGDTQAALSDEIINGINQYQENWHEFVDLMNKQRQAENLMRSIARYAEDKCEEAQGDQKAHMLKQISVANGFLLGIILVTIILAIVIAFLLSGSISNPLQTLTDTAVKIGEGDLRIEVPQFNRRDEIGILSDSFRNMIDNLRNQISSIIEAVNVMTSMVAEIIATSSQLAASTTETATAINETTTTVEEVKQTAQVNNDKAKAVLESSKKTLEVASNGENAVNETGDGMSLIQEKMEFIAESIMRLSEQSQAIAVIMNSINDLAEQSNLLAVNASIEAAKAGDEGKGFTVVAEEVKSLAEQSKQATKQVREILTDIQKATSTAVMATEEGSKVVENGIKQANNAGESIRILAETIDEAAQSSTQIGSSVQQQFVGIDQINEAMRNISIASKQNLEGTKQLEDASENLNELAKKLQELVEPYKI